MKIRKKVSLSSINKGLKGWRMDHMAKLAV